MVVQVGHADSWKETCSGNNSGTYRMGRARTAALMGMVGNFSWESPRCVTYTTCVLQHLIVLARYSYDVLNTVAPIASLRLHVDTLC